MLFDRKSQISADLPVDNADLPKEVQSLLRSYREVLPDFEGSPDFMPRLWQQIEAQQKVTYSFWRLASGFVTGSVALCMVFGLALWTPPSSGKQQTINSNSTYVEVLADDASDDGGPESAAI